MNICIVTVFYSWNLGSYQQANELAEAYSKYGDVYFLDRKIRRPYMWLGKTLRGCLLRFKFKQAAYELKKRIIFKKKYSHLKTITMKDIDKMDMFVLGSDEIWNLTRDIMNYSFLFGDGLGENIVSYAPSIGSTTAEQLMEKGYVEKFIKPAKLISVRDEQTKAILRQCGYDKDVDIVVDPTMLKSKESYEEENTDKTKPGYIAMYCFRGYLESGVYDSFSVYAKNKDLRIVSVGLWNDETENALPTSSGVFDTYINAESVITNTFHGTLFAILLNKKFVTFPGSKPKISHLLELFGLESRNGDGKSIDEIHAILDTDVDWDPVNRKIEEQRAHSLDYIKRSVDAIKNSNEGQK